MQLRSDGWVPICCDFAGETKQPPRGAAWPVGGEEPGKLHKGQGKPGPTLEPGPLRVITQINQQHQRERGQHEMDL